MYIIPFENAVVYETVVQSQNHNYILLYQKLLAQCMRAYAHVGSCVHVRVSVGRNMQEGANVLANLCVCVFQNKNIRFCVLVSVSLCV